MLFRSGYSLCIVCTGSHEELSGEYAAIPEEMKAVARACGVEVMADCDRGAFIERLPELRERCGDRAVMRALHFLNENERVSRQRGALKDGNTGEFFELVRASGRSSYMYLQNVLLPGDSRIQPLGLALAVSEDYLGERGACRVHGGGFAGTILSFVPGDMADGYRALMDGIYGGGACVSLNIRADGACRII